MRKDRAVWFWSPAFRDELSELVRQGAQRLIRRAVEAELKTFLDEHECERDGEGRRVVVRNGYKPEREVLTGIGPVRCRSRRRATRGERGDVFARSCCRRT